MPLRSVLVLIFCCLNLFVVSTYARAVQVADYWLKKEADHVSVNLIKLGDRQVVTFYGEAPTRSPYTMNKFIKFLKKNMNATPVYFLVFQNMGGINDDFANFMKTLKTPRGTRQSVTFLIMGPCESACTFWGSLADTSYIVSGMGTLRTHRPMRVALGGGGVPRLFSLEETAKEYSSMGARGNWILSHPEYFPERTTTPRSLDEEGFVTMTPKAALQLGLINGTIQFGDLPNLVGPSVYNWIRSLVR